MITTFFQDTPGSEPALKHVGIHAFARLVERSAEQSLEIIAPWAMPLPLRPSRRPYREYCEKMRLWIFTDLPIGSGGILQASVSKHPAPTLVLTQT